MIMTQKWINLSFIGALVLALTACDGAGGGGSADGQIVQPLKESTVILKYNGGTITAKDVNDQVKSRLTKLNEDAIDAYQRVAENVLVEKLLETEAKKQGLSTADDLLNKIQQEASVTDEEVDQFYAQNKLGEGYKDPQTGEKRSVSKEEVKKFLEEQARNNKRQDLINGLMAKAESNVVLEEPRIKLSIPSGAPVLGSKNAKVIIQEFSDFQCPFCSRAKDTVSQIHQAYGDKVAIVYNHMPLDFHPNAKPAAIASECAHKQDKFWPFHDKLFDSQRELADDKYAKWAEELGMDKSKFEDCLKDPSVEKAIDESMKLATTLGVNSTPTFFINGKRVAGALPFAQFKRIIDQELQ